MYTDDRVATKSFFLATMSNFVEFDIEKGTMLVRLANIIVCEPQKDGHVSLYLANGPICQVRGPYADVVAKIKTAENKCVIDAAIMRKEVYEDAQMVSSLRQ